jgi:hypothetical protein
VEPEWENGKPDFMLTTSEGKKILLEATGIYPKRWFGPAKQQEDVLLDRLNEQLDLPDYFLHVKVEKAGSGNPPFGKIRSYLQNQLVQLDYDDVVKDAREQEGLGQKQFPSWIWDNDAWKLKFTVSPKKEEARGKPGHPVGSTSSGFEYVDVASSIKSAIKRKYRRYGELDLPYIFALNVVDPFADGYSLADALFGQEVINLNFDTGERSISRQPNGSWLGPKDWQKTRMSAICVFKRLRPVMMHTVSPTIWHHPFAKNPLLPEIFKLAQQIPNLSTGTYERRDGQHPVELLNLDITRMPS